MHSDNIRVSHLAALLCGLLFLTPLAGQPVAADQPNMIFIMVDDLGYHDLGCYGQEVIQTPHLDRMATEGVKFTDAYCGTAVCAPSRSVLMTGQHTGHTRVRGNFGRFGVTGLGGRKGRVPLADEDVTIAEILQQAGYATGMVGKWGLGEPSTSGEPGRQGWDFFFGHLNQRRAHTYYPGYLWRNTNKVFYPNNDDSKEVSTADNGRTHSHTVFVQESLEFIRQHADQDRPFFLYLPWTMPHAQYQIPHIEPPYRDASWDAKAKVHASMVTRIDRDVGRLLSLLHELEIDHNTIVFFCSDNGAAQRWEGIFDSSLPFRGRKRDLYEGGIRTPMIVRWPGNIESGRTDHTPWAFWDILPTLADLAGATDRVPDGIDGVSIRPVLLGNQQPELSDRPLYWEFHSKQFCQAVRQGKWKAVRFYGQPIQLYDLVNDQAETHNIAAAHPDVVASLTAFMDTSHHPSDNWPAPVD